MRRLLGITTALLGFTSFAIFGVLGLTLYEPPIEAPWLLSAGRHPGEVIFKQPSPGEYWFEVAGLGRSAACTLEARGIDGRMIFHEASQDATQRGCKAHASAIAGDTWLIEFTSSTPGASVVAYESHGGGLPHIGALVISSLIVLAIGLIATAFGRRHASVVRENHGPPLSR